MNKTELKALQEGMQLKPGGIYVIHVGKDDDISGLKAISQETQIHFITLRPHQKVQEIPVEELKKIITYLEEKDAAKS